MNFHFYFSAAEKRALARRGSKPYYGMLDGKKVEATRFTCYEAGHQPRDGEKYLGYGRLTPQHARKILDQTQPKPEGKGWVSFNHRNPKKRQEIEFMHEQRKIVYAGVYLGRSDGDPLLRSETAPPGDCGVRWWRPLPRGKKKK